MSSFPSTFSSRPSPPPSPPLSPSFSSNINTSSSTSSQPPRQPLHVTTSISSAFDAASQKLRLVSLGYTDDPYADVFGKAAVGKGLTARRGNNPVINRGYYARVVAVDAKVEEFLKATEGRPRQVVELGSGLSTLYHRHKSHENLTWFEVDYPSVLQNKSSLSSSISTTGPSPYAPLHHVPCDLSLGTALTSLSSSGAVAEKPTLFILEAVLMYMSSSASTRLLSSLAAGYGEATVVVYDPVLDLGGRGRFGEVMRGHLSRAGVDCSGMDEFDTLERQLGRLTSCGFTASTGLTMLELWRALPPSIRSRAEAAEMLDEMEEWNMIMSHYVLLEGRNGGGGRADRKPSKARDPPGTYRDGHDDLRSEANDGVLIDRTEAQWKDSSYRVREMD